MRKESEFIQHNDINTLPSAVKRQQAYLDSNGDFKPSRFLSIVNPVTGVEYSSVSAQYHIKQHSEAIQEVEKAITANPEYGSYNRCIKTYGNGSKLVTKYTFPERPVTISQGDTVLPSITIRNDYSLSWSFTVIFGAFRLICSNGLIIGDTGLRFKRKHYFICQEFNSDMLSKGMHSFSEQKGIWETWLNEQWSRERVDNTLKSLDIIPAKNTYNELYSLRETGTGESLNHVFDSINDHITKWLFYNILSQYITHHVKSITRKTMMEDKMRRLF